MAAKIEYDIYLSYSSLYKSEAEQIATRLTENKLTVWIDYWRLRPGDDWQAVAREALAANPVVLVLLGPKGIGPHGQTDELNIILSSNINRIIPVLLPDASPEVLPASLKNRIWVDCRAGLDDEDSFRRLLAGIRGEAPGGISKETGEKKPARKTSSQASSVRIGGNENAPALKTRKAPAEKSAPSSAAQSEPEPDKTSAKNEPAGASFSIGSDESAVAEGPLYLVRISILLNTRSGPGISFPTVGQLKEGDIVAIIEEQTDDKGQIWGRIDPSQWILISYDTGIKISEDQDVNAQNSHDFELKDFTTNHSASEEGMDVETMYKGKLVARTALKFDGDSTTILPMQKNEGGGLVVDEFVNALHQKNVQAAIELRTQEIEKHLANKSEAPKKDAPKPDMLQAAIEANRLVNNRSQAVFNDRAQGEDQLGIKDEVEALAETLLLRDVEPPVAVGVIGGWGSGKSFVLYLINQYVQSTRAKKVKKGWPTDGNEKDPEIPAFVGHIYQINFNAWTYAKSNLWASLMDTIFSGLSQQMQLERLLAHKDFAADVPAPTSEQIKASMLAGGDEFKKIYPETLQIDQDKDLLPWRKNLIHWSQHLLKETLLWNIMRGQQVETLEKLKDTEEQLKQLKLRRAQFEKDHPLREITATALNQAARQAYLQSIKGYLLAFVTDKLSQAAKDELGKQDVSEDEIKKHLKDARGLVGAFNTLLTAYRRSRIYSIWTLLFLVITLAIPYFWSTYAPDSIYKWITQAVSLLVTLLPLLTVLVPWLQKSVKFGLDAKQILEGAYAAQQAKQAEQITNSTEKPLPQKISELQKEISAGSVAAYDNLISLLETQAEEQRQQIGPSAKYANLSDCSGINLKDKAVGLPKA